MPNLFAALGHLAPASLAAVLNAEGALASGSLSKQDLETIKLLVSVQTGGDYCVAAHNMLGKMVGLPADALRAIRAAGYTDTQLAEISLAIALIIFTNTFNRINDTDVDFPPLQ